MPSGGTGEDGSVSEGEAIKEYLVSRGVGPEDILVEDRAENTGENIRYSMELVMRDSTDPDPKTAFCTTNYHVLRTGITASEAGFSMEGTGSRTKSYFWINAFVREFIATVVSERKTHLRVIALLCFLDAVMSTVACLSVIL